MLFLINCGVPPIGYDNGGPMDNRKTARLDQISLPGVFTNCKSGKNFFGKISNISEEGVGVSSIEELQEGAFVNLTTLDGDIKFEIQWKKFNEQTNTYHYGFVCTANHKNLFNLFYQCEGPLKTPMAS